MGHFYKGAALEEITRQHSHVLNEKGESTAA
jgi:hypothetical protein